MSGVDRVSQEEGGGRRNVCPVDVEEINDPEIQANLNFIQRFIQFMIVLAGLCGAKLEEGALKMVKHLGSQGYRPDEIERALAESGYEKTAHVMSGFMRSQGTQALAKGGTRILKGR